MTTITMFIFTACILAYYFAVTSTATWFGSILKMCSLVSLFLLAILLASTFVDLTITSVPLLVNITHGLIAVTLIILATVFNHGRSKFKQFVMTIMTGISAFAHFILFLLASKMFIVV